MKLWIPRLHRWLGIGSLVFVLLLSATGIALNHSADLSLDQRYARASWLLRWYGIDAPNPSASFSAGEHTVVLIGERLYFDEIELADGVSDLVGAVATSTHTAVATPSRVLLVAGNGSLVEQIATTAMLPAEITRIGSRAEDLIYASADRHYQSDHDVLDIIPAAESSLGKVVWSTPVALPRERLVVLQQLYRGRGLSVERLLLDLHSGRVLSSAGPWLMDVVGVVLIVLGVLGLVLWLRPQGRRRPRA